MFKKALTVIWLRWIFNAGLCKHLLFCFSYFFLWKPACHVWKHTVFGGFTLLAYPQTSHSNTTLPWFTFDRLQPCLTLTHSQPRSSRFNCLLSSLVHIHSRCSSSPSSSLLHGRSFLPCVGCGVASVCRDSVRERKEGEGGSQVCLLSPQYKLTQRKMLPGSVSCLRGSLSTPTLLLFSEQWPEEFNKGGEARGQATSGWHVPLYAVGQHGPLMPQTPPALCAS